MSSQAAEEELNGFLARHRVIAVDRRWVDLGTSSFWAICVDYLAAGSGDARRRPSLGRNRVDYKQVLAPDEFTVFSRLRELRKEIAQADAVPVYAVLTLGERLRGELQRQASGRAVTEAWREDYNRVRPHGALGNRTPSEFARPVAGHAQLPALHG